jgi:hypothetical protein
LLKKVAADEFFAALQVLADGSTPATDIEDVRSTATFTCV